MGNASSGLFIAAPPHNGVSNECSTRHVARLRPQLNTPFQAWLKSLVRILSLAAFVGSVAACMYPTEDRTFWGEAREALEEVRSLLIQRGICQDEARNCTGYVFRDPAFRGFELLTFGVRDLGVLAEIKNIAYRKLTATPNMSRVIVTAYAGDGSIPAFNKPPKRVGLIFRQEFKK